MCQPRNFEARETLKESEIRVNKIAYFATRVQSYGPGEFQPSDFTDFE